MKALKLTSLTIISLFTLVACSSGGSSNPAPATKTVGTTPSPPPAQPTPSNPRVYPIQGQYLFGAKANNVGWTISTLRGENLNILKNIESIPLTDPANQPEEGYYKIGNGIVNDDSMLKNTRFGIIEGERQAYIFSQGVKTENIPTAGRAIYKGEALISFVDSDDVYKRLNYVYGLPSTFDVDFDNKTLIGSIKYAEDRPNLIFDAQINGDKFSKWGGLDNIEVEGAFYGKDASELGGVFMKRDTFSGSFGAKKEE